MIVAKSTKPYWNRGLDEENVRVRNNGLFPEFLKDAKK